MNEILEKLIRPAGPEDGGRPTAEGALRKEIGALFQLLVQVHGAERLVVKAAKLEALGLMRSDRVEDHALALMRLVREDPALGPAPSIEEVPQILEELEDLLADQIARRNVEESLEKKVAERMQQRHEEYVREVRLQVIREEAGPETPHSLKKLAELKALRRTRLSRSALEMMRPTSLDQVVGQEAAVRAVLAKLASPFPQHILLYGPPGVGKTTVARLALEAAKALPFTPFGPKAPFVEVDGTTLRWDPREITNPLLGSVHDPIYQGARRELAETAVPEPKLGLVTEAHGGVLFIDEIGEMDPILQNKLLKVLEEKKVTFDSAYYDPDDPNVPQWIKLLFEEGAPADFILIGATTRSPEEISPALRSRCAEVFFEPLTPDDVARIVREAAQRLGIRLEDGVAELVADYTIEGRKAVGILADAYSIALYQAAESGALPDDLPWAGRRRRSRRHPDLPPVTVTREQVLEVIRISRLTPQVTAKASDRLEVGRIHGLGVLGYVGSVLEIEAVAFPAREPGKGSLRFNEAAGPMAKDSVFNAGPVIRRLTGRDLRDYDVHVNVVGGGRIDGPSAGLAITLAILSALEELPLRQDVALTGEISLRGEVRAVGGIYEKIYGAKQAGMRKVLIPAENAREMVARVGGIEVVPVATVAEALAHLAPGWQQRQAG
ncbi:MAG: Lon family ATP-dependent protease [Firmicutes bacterium]|nr:Lon family ATP-dependent protease [Bacillota bacterium]